MNPSRSIFRLSLAAAVLFSAQTVLAMGDIAKGEQIFKKCRTCHSITKNKHKVGPTLVSIVGRQAATAVDSRGKAFKYSKAMRKAGADGIVWTPENLEKFLTRPKDFVPKTRMAFRGLKKPADRADVIAYLKSKGQ